MDFWTGRSVGIFPRQCFESNSHWGQSSSCFREAVSHSSLLVLFLPSLPFVPVFPPSHQVLFIDSEIAEETEGGSGRRNWTWGQTSTGLLPEETFFFLFFTDYSRTLSSVVFFLSFLKSSSACSWAGFKDSKCEESNFVWVNTTDQKLPTALDLVHPFCRLAPCFCFFFCVIFSDQILLPPLIINPVTDWWAKKKKKMDSRIKFEQTDIFSSSRRKNRTHVSDWPLSLTYNLYLWKCFLTFLPSHLRSDVTQIFLKQELPVTPSAVSNHRGTQTNLTTGTFVLWIPVSVRFNS